MKSVIVHIDCILRDSHVAVDNPPADFRLMPATLEAMRLLGGNGALLLIWGGVGGKKQSSSLAAVRQQIESGGGRVDGLISCPHMLGEECRCWGSHPGALWAAAIEFDLRLNECYVLADTMEDVESACVAGARPMLVLGGRAILSVQGSQPAHSGYPVAADLILAVSYIAVEEEISTHLGHPRGDAVAMPAVSTLYQDPSSVPVIQITSARGEDLRSRLRKSRIQLADMTRWLTFFVLGALGLSLGIAYILTHLYRSQPFPEAAYWITLQFISRPLRGALFIMLGVGGLVLAVRRFYRAALSDFWARRRPS